MHLLTSTPILSVTLLILAPIITALIFWSSLSYTSTAIGIVIVSTSAVTHDAFAFNDREHGGVPDIL